MTTSKDNSSLVENWTWLMKTWLAEKERAKKWEDWDGYIWFLKELKKDFSKVYAGFTNQAWIDLFDKVFETVSCELKESIIKSNNKRMSEAKKKKAISEMTDEELTKAYQAGSQWLIINGQETGSELTKAGKPYNDELWQLGLKKIERMEDEMKKRGLAI